MSKDLKPYIVEITIHETGTIEIMSSSVSQAVKDVREGEGWDQFNQTEVPWVGVKRAWKT
jgi:hypothetical protein